MRSIVDNRIGEKVLRVRQPTLVVWGTRDYIVPHGFVVSLACSLPRGHLAVIPGAAYGINYLHPEAFTAVLLPFLLAAGCTELKRQDSASVGFSADECPLRLDTA